MRERKRLEREDNQPMLTRLEVKRWLQCSLLLSASGLPASSSSPPACYFSMSPIPNPVTTTVSAVDGSHRPSGLHALVPRSRHVKAAAPLGLKRVRMKDHHQRHHHPELSCCCGWLVLRVDVLA